MAEYDNTNKGAIWKNEKKQKDTDFDFTGSIDVEGKEFLIGAWKKAPGAKDNAPVLKFSITPKTGGKATVDADPTPPPITDEDIPF